MCIIYFYASIIKFSDDRVNPEGITNFAGWARMALPITTFSIVEVRIYSHVHTTHGFVNMYCMYVYFLHGCTCTCTYIMCMGLK